MNTNQKTRSTSIKNAAPRLAAIILSFASFASFAQDGGGADISIRTESFARPPYSGATYFIYEKGGTIICTKLEVCNKFGDCTSEYKKGAFKEEGDDESSGKSDKTVIPSAKVRKHKCLTQFGLIK
jgi:hypothetical protein